MLSPQTPNTDKLGRLAANMRLDPLKLQAIKQQAHVRGLEPGRFVTIDSREEVGLVVRFNEDPLSIFPGHEYPLVVLTGFGEFESDLDSLSPCTQDVLAILEDDTETAVRAAQGPRGWELQDACGKPIPVDQLVEMHADTY